MLERVTPHHPVLCPLLCSLGKQQFGGIHPEEQVVVLGLRVRGFVFFISFELNGDA